MHNSYVFWVVISLYQAIILSLPTIDAPGIVIGTCQPITTQCTNNNPSFTTTLVPGSMTTIKSLGMSLLGYETFVSSIIFISPKITQTNTTHITMQATCMENLLFTKLQFSYIIIATTVQYLNVYTKCFLCPPQDTVNGQRIYSFGLQPHKLPYLDHMKVVSSIAGMNVSNVQENGVSFQVQTTMVLNDPIIYHKISGHRHTVVSSICITTIVYDHSFLSTENYRILVSFEQKQVNSVNWASNMLPVQPFFINLNSMYYGISSIKIYFQSATTQTMLFDVNNFPNLFSNFKGNHNINHIKIQGFFIRKINCPVADFFDPLSYACVSACPAQTGPNPTTKYCEPCHATCASCVGSGIDKCNSCNNATINKFRHLRGGLPVSYCDCQVQYFEASDGSAICRKCSDVIQNCMQCPDSKYCSLCMTGFSYNSVTNKCGCTDLTKYLSRGVCMNYPGCISVMTSINIVQYCGACNEGLNFELVRDNYTCKCKDGYKFHPPSISCIEYCGDGIVLNDECDDGNNDGGDGCSAECKIQKGYMCMTSIEPSMCMKQIKFELSYEYCKRDITSNLATFAFLLTPPTPTLSQVDLTKSFVFTFASKISSYTYDDQTGKLQVVTKFTTTLQGSQHGFTMNFGSVGIWTDPLTTNFQVKGMNAWIIMDEYAGNYKYVMYGIAMVCAMAWVLGLIAALMGFKNLTLELILPIQALYFVVVSFGSNAPGLRALHFMNFINGYNSLEGFQMKEVVSEKDTGYSHLEYLSNMNYFIIVDIGCVVLLFIVKGVHFLVNRKFVNANEKIDNLGVEDDERKQAIKGLHGEERKKAIEGREQEKPKKLTKQQQANNKASLQALQTSLQKSRFSNKITENCLLFLGERFASTVLLLALQSSIFYIGTFMIYTSEYRLYSPFVNNMFCLVSVILAFIGLSVYPQEKEKQVHIVFENKLKYSYTKLFTLWYVVFIIVLLIVCSFQVTGLMLIAIVLPCLVLGVLVVKNPYKTKNAPCLRFILPFVQHCFLTAPCVMLWVVSFLKTLNPIFYFITTIMIVGCCFLGLILTGVRIYFQLKNYRLSQKHIESQDDEEQQEQQKDIFKQLKQGNDKSNNKSTPSKLQENQQFNTHLKDNLLNKSNPIKTTNTRQEDECGTKKSQVDKKNQRKESIADEEDYSSNCSQVSQNLEDIKKRLRKDLRQKRNVRKR